MPPSRSISNPKSSSKPSGRQSSTTSTSHSKRKRAPSTASSTGTSTSPSPTPKLKAPTASRAATVYDAVAGLVTTHGFNTSTSNLNPSYFRDTLSHSLKPLTPAEILASATNAPERYLDDDPYDLARHLVPNEVEAARLKHWIVECSRVSNEDGKREDEETVQKMLEEVQVGKLPDGDLLRAVHLFASRYYAVHDGKADWRSLDETALLAIGILLEEEVRSALGESGWRAFIEEEREDAMEELTNPISRRRVSKPERKISDEGLGPFQKKRKIASGASKAKNKEEMVDSLAKSTASDEDIQESLLADFESETPSTAEDSESKDSDGEDSEDEPVSDNDSTSVQPDVSSMKSAESSTTDEYEESQMSALQTHSSPAQFADIRFDQSQSSKTQLLTKADESTDNTDDQSSDEDGDNESSEPSERDESNPSPRKQRREERRVKLEAAIKVYGEDF